MGKGRRKGDLLEVRGNAHQFAERGRAGAAGGAVPVSILLFIRCFSEFVGSISASDSWAPNVMRLGAIYHTRWPEPAAVGAERRRVRRLVLLVDWDVRIRYADGRLSLRSIVMALADPASGLSECCCKQIRKDK